MHSMSLMSMTNSMASLDLDFNPEFVNLDPRYKCVKCHQWLKRPFQTSCGHRICKSCLDELLKAESEHGRGVPCPADDEGCELITQDKVYPDPSAAREIKQQKVFCAYKKYGCEETPSLGKLKEHMDHCKCIQGCQFCNEKLPPDQLDNHIKNICREAVIKCQYDCGIKDQPRWKMEDHYCDCPCKPISCKYNRLGCTTTLKKDLMLKHEKEDSTHLELLVERVSMLELENTRLLERVQSALGDLDSVRLQLSQSLRENEELKRKIFHVQETQRQADQQHTQTIIQQKEKMGQLESQVRRLEEKSREIAQIQTQCGQMEVKLNSLEHSQPQEVTLPEDVRKTFITHDRTIGLHDVRLSELDLRLQCTETANYEGVLIWKIGEYRERKRQAVEGRILSLYSQPFYTSRYGYKMCARVYLNGDGVGRGSHMSMFFVVMQGDYDDILSWPFKQKVTLTLIDQRNNRRHLSDTFRPDPTSTSFQKPTSPMNVASGCPLFVQHTVLEDEREGLYLRNNTIFIKVVVDTSDLMNP